MKTNKIQHIRLLIVTALMLVCGGWNGVVWGQTAATTTLTLSNFTATESNTKKYNTLVSDANKKTFDLTSILQSITNTLNEKDGTNMSSNEVLENLYLRWYIIDNNNNIINIATTDWEMYCEDAYNYRLYNNSYFVYNVKHATPWTVHNTNALKIDVTKPSTEAWINYKVICLLTNDRTGLSPDLIVDYNENKNVMGTLE